MRIVVITDVHANLPALKAALASIRSEGYDLLIHTGDAIAIGPYPQECLELLLSIPNARFTLGNHEIYYLHGLPTPQPAWMSDGEVEHQLWTHAQLDGGMRSALAEWPYLLEQDFEGVKTTFVHYGLDASGTDFQRVIWDATAADLDNLFALPDADLVFYGHNHRSSDVTGCARYVNPGSLGCFNQALARYCVVELHRGQYTVEQRGVPYDDAGLFNAFEQCSVPEREFIYRVFFGGRFGTGQNGSG
jgi:predicted phosphodiesterase